MVVKEPSGKIENQELKEITILNNIGKEKITSLKENVKDVNELIQNRETLNKEIFNEGEKIKMEINNLLLENETKKEERFAPNEKMELVKKKIEITELQLNEKVSCWKDVALLKKELREKTKELNEKEERINSLKNFLEE